MRAIFVTVPLVLALVTPGWAQQPARAHVDVATIAPRAEDIATLDGILKAFYDVISGSAGEPRQWSRDRSLYIPDVRFVSLSKDSAGAIHANVVDHQTHRATHRFGNIVHVFSTYDMRQRTDGPSLGRGINSVELFWDGARWWISGVQWDDERPDNPIPPEYLPAP